MGLSTKQVSGDQGLDWGQTFLQSAAVAVAAAAAETSKPPSTRRQQPQQQQQSEPLKCPRCASINTKFCYYNNYNKSQPRHFCKSCKRHWTKGGTLRNVPVGGGRKNKRPKISKPAAAAPAALRQQDFSTSSSGGGGQKNMSNILYHALIGRSSSPLLQETSKGIENIIASSGGNAAAPQIIPNTEFNLSSCLTSFDMNASLNPAASSYEPLNAASYLDSMEESTITSVNNIPGGPWAGPELDLPNYNWNWNDIDVLTSGDLISISWDDDVDKMKP